MYDELNLDEEEEKFRMPNDESESEDSEEASEGMRDYYPPSLSSSLMLSRLASTNTVEET